MAVVHRSKLLAACSTILLIAGIWTIISGYALGGTAAAEWNGVIFGILLILCSLGRLAAPLARGYSVANIVWSIWLIISPWTFASTAGLRWSSDVTGIIALIFAIAAVRQIPMVTALPETGMGPTRRAA